MGVAVLCAPQARFTGAEPQRVSGLSQVCKRVSPQRHRTCKDSQRGCEPAAVREQVGKRTP